MANQFRDPSRQPVSSYYSEDNVASAMRPFDNIVLDQDSQPDLVPSSENQLYGSNGAPGQSPNFNSFSFNTYNNAYPDALEDMKAMAGLPVAGVPLGDHLSPRDPDYANMMQSQNREQSQLINEYDLQYDVPNSAWHQQKSVLSINDGMQYSSFNQQAQGQGPPQISINKDSSYVSNLRKQPRNAQSFSYSSPAIVQVKKESPDVGLKIESPGESGDDYNKKGGKTRSAHNIIEQRYRNRMNDKFTALQNCVPTLRAAVKRGSKTRSDFDTDMERDKYGASDGEKDDGEDLEGLAPATKLNKATILTKSVEYIKFLEKKNNRMRSEHRQLIERAQMLGVSLSDDLLLSDSTDNRGSSEGK